MSALGQFVEKWTFSCPGGGSSDCSLQSCLTLYGHIKTAEQRTIVQQYGDWYTGRWWVGCYIWYSEEGSRGRARALPRSLLAVPNVTAHPSTTSVPTSYYSVWHCNCLGTLRGQSRHKRLTMSRCGLLVICVVVIVPCHVAGLLVAYYFT